MVVFDKHSNIHLFINVLTFTKGKFNNIIDGQEFSKNLSVVSRETKVPINQCLTNRILVDFKLYMYV